MLFVLLKNQLSFLLPLVLPLNFDFKFIIFGPFPFTEIYHETIHGLPSTLQVNYLCGKKTRCQHPKHTAVAGEDQIPLMLTAEQPLLHLMQELSTPILAP